MQILHEKMSKKVPTKQKQTNQQAPNPSPKPALNFQVQFQCSVLSSYTTNKLYHILPPKSVSYDLTPTTSNPQHSQHSQHPRPPTTNKSFKIASLFHPKQSKHKNHRKDQRKFSKNKALKSLISKFSFQKQCGRELSLFQTKNQAGRHKRFTQGQTQNNQTSLLLLKQLPHQQPQTCKNVTEDRCLQQEIDLLFSFSSTIYKPQQKLNDRKQWKSQPFNKQKSQNNNFRTQQY
eukprot:TRINITY_DN5141_c0_g1_i13.p4 TRINITY_DN5141_c0_g1~~TRINITY_DN5141_c0_g1_i13.p4  ORF type:complete len:233 (+),score=-6.61 TRINITY_DN5141_c0_g1_i13:823-1521(+)